MKCGSVANLRAETPLGRQCAAQHQAALAPDQGVPTPAAVARGTAAGDRLERSTTRERGVSNMGDRFALSTKNGIDSTDDRMSRLMRSLADKPEALKTLLEHGEFKPVTTKSPEEAASILFEQALPVTPNASSDCVQRGYEAIKDSWSSQKLVEGSRDEVKSVILTNLRRIGSEPNFESFSVRVDLHAEAANVFAFAGGYAIGVRVWRSENVYYACGNSDFCPEYPSYVVEKGKTAMTDQQMLDVLRRLCNAYTQNNTAVISRLEPLATQIGEELNRRGGIEEMRRMWDQLGNMRGARTLDGHWDGIGDWRG